MVYCGSGVLCLNGMGFPSAVVSSSFMHRDLGARRCLIKVERHEDSMLGGEGHVELGGAVEIEGDEDLQEKPVPYVQIELWIGATYACNHVVLEGAYCPLAYVASVTYCGDELEVYTLVMHKSNQGLTRLIVEVFELGSEAVGDEDGVGVLIRKLYLVASS